MARKRMGWKRVALAVVLVAFAGEVVAEILHAIVTAKAAARTKPYYQFSFHSQDGSRIGGNEGILRLLYHPQVGYVNFPNQRTDYFAINAQGFRADREFPPTSDRERIVVLGGSTAFGTGLDSNEETFASHLEKLVPGSEVVNAAVIGHRSGQELTHLATSVLDLQPDLVIALDGANDAFQIGGAAERWFDVNGGVQFERELATASALTHSNLLARIARMPIELLSRTREMAAVLAAVSIGGLKAVLPASVKDRLRRLVGSTESEDPYRFAEGRLQIEDAAERYARNAEKMAMITRATGGRFLIALQPTRSSVSAEPGDPRAKEIYARFRASVKERLAEKGIPVLDLSDSAGRIDAGMFMDEAHLDDRGNRVMAEITSEVIAGER